MIKIIASGMEVAEVATSEQVNAAVYAALTEGFALEDIEVKGEGREDDLLLEIQEFNGHIDNGVIEEFDYVGDYAAPVFRVVS